MEGSQATQDIVANYLQENPDFADEWFRKNIAEAQKTQSNDRTEDRETLKPSLDFSPAHSAASTKSMTCRLFEEIIARKVTDENKGKHTLKDMDERELMMELIRDVANELDVDILCKKIMDNISILTNSDRESLFLATGFKDNKYLECKLSDVTKSNTLDIKIPFGKGIAGHVAETKETINIKNAYEDARFNTEIDKKTGYRTHSILCMPILSYAGNVIGVAQLINKKGKDHEFTEEDEKVFRDYLAFCGIGLTNAQLFEMSVEERWRNQLLLKLAAGIFEQQRSMDKLIQKIMIESQELLKCERTTVYILKENEDNSKNDFSFVYNLYSKDHSVRVPTPKELAKSKCADIAKRVSSTKKSLNISDPENDPLFAGQLLDYDDLKIRNMVCLPICNLERRVIGIVQFVNKMKSGGFSDNDFNFLQVFAIFCGLGIHNTQVYENVCQLTAKRIVNLGLISYHATIQEFDSDGLSETDVPPAEQFNLYKFEFNDMALSDVETTKATIRMFLECDVLRNFKIPYKVLCSWLLSVQKNYRPVTYHNWRHGLNVAQSMFTILHSGGMKSYMSDLEVFGLIVAALCHDLDHRGTNNAFQVKTGSPLAVLYGTSTMEHHHYDQCMMILQSEGNNIIQGLSNEDHSYLTSLIEHAILSTDLALHFKKRGNFKKLVEEGETKWQEPEKKNLLIGVMMTACDLSSIAKPWKVQRKVAKKIASEFFEQGDLERSQLFEEPIPMMDRNKKRDLPKMQVGFIDAICLPMYSVIKDAFPNLKPMYDGCVTNRDEWYSLSQQSEIDIWKTRGSPA